MKKQHILWDLNFQYSKIEFTYVVKFLSAAKYSKIEFYSQIELLLYMVYKQKCCICTM